MNRSQRLLVAMLALITLFAASCGSSEDSAVDSTVDAVADASSDASAGDDEAMADDAMADDDGAMADDAMADGDVTLTWWTWGGSGHDNVIAAFEEANPGVNVEVTIAGFDEHHEKLLAGFVSGEVPDVAMVEVGYSSLFKANPGNFTDLGATYGAGDVEGDFIPFRWEHGVAPDGTIIGLPTDVGGLAVAYRSDLFGNAGLPTEPDEVTAMIPDWDSFLDLGEKFIANTPDGGKYIDTSGLLFESVVKQGPEGFYSTDGELIYDSSDHIAEAWRLATDAIDRGLSANLGAFSPEWNAAMANGDHAVQLAPAWMMNYIAGQAPDTAGNWRLAEFPGGGGNWGGAQLTIPADAPHKDLAWDLISWVSTADNQLQIFKDFGNFPSIQSLFTDDDLVGFENEHFGGQQVGAVYAESILSVEPQFEGIDQRTLLREFTGALGEIENGNMTPDDAWKSALDAIALEIG